MSSHGRSPVKIIDMISMDKESFIAMGPLFTLFLAVDVCIALNEMACSLTQCGSIFILLVGLFMFKERL